ncbi:DUF2207 domain-containing protein [Streptococcus pacificus]|uniref:DUF2207 domain-containing protein n=1 Tax=Streptococcus pacificus TaxID=2740577 RepID=A0ABS0ZIH7_9STRE|nr:DUF2207 domain-containing protein [Streptococcus pacificus]MBJ8325794.1 DUF2207 domain-containing protein [Streptococcus pacificus]
MKRIILILFAALFFLFNESTYADVSYSIPYYSGELIIHEDNTANFKQIIDYDFDSSYNGQIVTLGQAGKMPEGFYIDPNPVVTVYHNNILVNSEQEVTDLGDGYSLKIYNKGQKGDKVVVVVEWQLKEILFAYQDIAELNWVPISDWDRTLKQVDFTVKTDFISEDQNLYAHTGFGKRQPTITSEENAYHLIATNVSNRLELHGYWEGSPVSTEFKLPTTRKEDFNRLENDIAFKQAAIHSLLDRAFPIAIGFLAILAIFFFLLFKRHVEKHHHFNKKSHLFNLPDDLPPLIVAKYIYEKTLKSELNQTSSYMGKISFENLLKASLLDLIDRQILTVSQDKELSIVSKDRASAFERELITFAFGEKEKIAINQLFSTFLFNKHDIKALKKSYKGEELTEKINHLGDRFNHKLESKLNKIDQLVAEAIENKALEKIKRDFLPSDLKYYRLSLGASVLGLILSIVALIIVVIIGNVISPYSLVYLASIILVITMISYFAQRKKVMADFGFLEARGHDVLQDWVSFNNMLRDIRKFDQVEIEAVVIWNRILIYATLLGFAQKVEKYLSTVHPQFVENSLYQSYLFISPQLSRQTKAVMSSNSYAVEASHFSVSSGGSSGGGFSGGGGGGGGGAF